MFGKTEHHGLLFCLTPTPSSLLSRIKLLLLRWRGSGQHLEECPPSNLWNSLAQDGAATISLDFFIFLR